RRRLRSPRRGGLHCRYALEQANLPRAERPRALIGVLPRSRRQSGRTGPLALGAASDPRLPVGIGRLTQEADQLKLRLLSSAPKTRLDLGLRRGDSLVDAPAQPVHNFAKSSVRPEARSEQVGRAPVSHAPIVAGFSGRGQSALDEQSADSSPPLVLDRRRD